MAKTSEAQSKANRKWQENNKAQINRIKKRSAARNFIKKEANNEELIEFEELIVIRRDELKKMRDDFE